MIALALIGCWTPPEATPTAEAEAVSYPHAAGYDAGVGHGPEALRAPAACGGCHRPESDAPPCAECHQGYPHTPGWLAGAVHGEGLVGLDGPAARGPCADCHDTPGLTAPSCTSCHPSWPHPNGWATGGAHGAWALARGSATAVCGSCHGPELGGSPTAPSCTSCHPSWPHAPGWAGPDGHPLADPATCAGCHGGPGAVDRVGVPCARCHAAYPHPADVRTAHIAKASRLGEPVCLGCHAPGDGGSPLLATCSPSCHGRIE